MIFQEADGMAGLDDLLAHIVAQFRRMD